MSRHILVLSVLASVIASPAAAHEVLVGAITVEHPWTRAIAKGAPTAVGYMNFRNAGATAARLVGATTPAARTVEIHETTATDGIMRMRPVPQGVAIPAGGMVELAPNGTHLMLIGPSDGFTKGQRVALTLRFEVAGDVVVEMVVEGPGARQSTHDGH